MKRLLLLLVPLLWAGVPRARAEDDARDLSFLTFDRYYDVEQVGAALYATHAAFPRATRLESMGRSREGRELHVLTVFDPAAGDPDAKPAMYIDGNTHGNEVQATEVCLYTIKYLLTKDDPWVRELLRHVTFHIAPCVNPDARHRFFHTPQTPHGPRHVLRPYDNDRDGQADEDGPDDLDGDGHILRMRIRDPNGDQVVDERDDRLLRPREPGEQGQYRMLGVEGTDEDGDGRLNEDGEGGVDPNRNWPAQWRPARHQYGAGPYPLSEPETRSTALWILDRPHIAGVQSYHNTGRMILRPPAAWSDDELGVPHSDRKLYDAIAKRGLVVLPSYEYLTVRKLYQVFGGFIAWTWLDLGAFSFTNELWGDLGMDVPDAGDDRRLAALRWNDVALHGNGFVRWYEVDHPQYGKVELGGWKRFTVRTTPPDFLSETCVRNTLFSLEHAAMLPRLRLETLGSVSEGRLRVRITNDGVLPTIHGLARRQGTLPADRLRLEGARILAASRPRTGQRAEVVEVRGGTVRLPDGIEGKTAVELDLYVEGAPKALVLESRIGGDHREVIE